jgi:negative regulator of flagellin synthesis FlgM
MDTSDFDTKNHHIEVRQRSTDKFCEAFDVETDPTAAEVLETIHSTPLGRLLRMIGSLPEIRHEKVFDVRRQISHGQYDLNDNLDVALDRVLEELITES